MSDSIDRNTILNAIAPCALACFTCAAMKDGVIEETSKKLSNYLKGYYDFNRKNLPLKYKSYIKQIKILTEQVEKLSHRHCMGCRNGANEKCCIPDCFILECAKQHEVDFCAECEEFPCNRAMEFFKGAVLEEWKRNNERIRETSAEDYYKYAVSKSHYLFYSED